MCLSRGAGRAALAAFVAGLACSNNPTEPGGSGTTVGYSLGLVPPELTIPQGSSATAAATLSRTGGFGGTVTLAAIGVPAGMQVTFAPSTTTGSTMTISITIMTGTARPGVFPITIRGTASGLIDQTAVLTLTVIATGGTTGYTIALPPLPLRIAQGAQGTAFATLTRTGGFSGTVTFSATEVPAGALVTFTPSATRGAETSIRVMAGTALVGTYVITILGTAVGLADQTAELTVTVTAGGSGSRSTTFRIIRVQTELLAYRDPGVASRRAATTAPRVPG